MVSLRIGVVCVRVREGDGAAAWEWVPVEEWCFGGVTYYTYAPGAWRNREWHGWTDMPDDMVARVVWDL